MRVSEPQVNVCEQSPPGFMPNVLRHAHSSANGLIVGDPGKMKVHFVQSKLNHTEQDRRQEVLASTTMNQLTSKLIYKVCIHHEVPLRSVSFVLLLNKSLCISLVESVEGMRDVQPVLYRSATSCRLTVPSQCKSTDRKLAYGRGRLAMLGNNKYRGLEEAQRRSFLLKNQNYKPDQAALVCGVSSKANSSDTHHQSDSFGLLPFKWKTTSNTKTDKQKGNADKAGVSAPTSFKDFDPAVGPDSGTWIHQAGGEKTGGDQEDGKVTELQTLSTFHHHSQLKIDSVQGTLSLKEALELFRPDFISRSQGRIRRMEQRARRRKALQDSNPDLVWGMKEDQGKQKRNCTTPDPLSDKETFIKISGLLGQLPPADNLFKPRERSISGREMQQRSRRIYNKLPEVTKKKEEEKKRAVSESNRLRAELFKKRILDQILQR